MFLFYVKKRNKVGDTLFGNIASAPLISFNKCFTLWYLYAHQ